MKYLSVIIISAFLPNLAFSQIRDTIAVIISKAQSTETINDLYNVRILNVKKDPVCIMHSAYINLFFDPPQRLAVFRTEKSFDIFSLHWAANDTLYDDYENDNYDAEVILPLQEINFRLFIPHSTRDKRMVIEYIDLPDYC
jgi:hypothetical protein